MYLWVILKDEMILARLSLNPLKNIGFRVGVICQISRDLWVSREFSFSSFLLPPLVSDATCQLMVAMGDYRVSLTKLGRVWGAFLSWSLKIWHEFLCWVPFSPGGYFQMKWRGRPGQGGRGPWPWSPMGWGGEPLLSVLGWIPCLPSAILTPLELTGGSLDHSQSFCSEDASLLGTTIPSSSSSEI